MEAILDPRARAGRWKKFSYPIREGSCQITLLSVSERIAVPDENLWFLDEGQMNYHPKNSMPAPQTVTTAPLMAWM
ncbi:hypothetical protein GCM10011405_34040 [Rufibacter glacialis]|nr:hypothetical protein GCM10011405_34040 [Rufibacter glacialis]